MANTIFTKFLELRDKGQINWESAVVKCLLVRSTSTYTVDCDHNYLSSFTTGGGVEISVATYARLALASKAVIRNDTDNYVGMDAADLNFGYLEPGQTVSALLFYIQVGGDDTTPADDILVCWYDTASNGVLPAVLGGGEFKVAFNAAGLIKSRQA